MTPAQMTEPGSVILTADEVLTVLDAVDEVANEYAYRAESRLAKYRGDRGFYEKQAAAMSTFADTLRERAGIAVDRS